MSVAPATQSPNFSLQGLTIEPVLNTNEDPTLAIHGEFPRHKYEKLLIHGFSRKLTTNEIFQHPLIRLLHDYKHLMLHGDRGDRNTRAAKRKGKKPFENHFCRLGFVYTISQDPNTCDLIVRFVIDTAAWPVWTNYDGSTQCKMTLDDIARTTANAIETYIVEAEELIKSEGISCHIKSTTVIEVTMDENPPKTATPPPENDII